MVSFYLTEAFPATPLGGCAQKKAAVQGVSQSYHTLSDAESGDSFAFSAAQKIMVSPPSSRRRPSCHRQLGFHFRISTLAKKKTTPMGWSSFVISVHFRCRISDTANDQIASQNLNNSFASFDSY